MSSASIPPATGVGHFRAASAILADGQPAPLHRTFGATAREVEQLSAELVTLLNRGTPLEQIDSLARRLGQKCLQVQQQTLVARRDGAR